MDALLNGTIEYKVIIASVYYSEIKEQLLAMRVKKQNIVLSEAYVLYYINLHMKDMMNEKTIELKEDKNWNILIDLAEGVILGGVEKWSITLAEGFYAKNRNVTLLTNKIEERMLSDKKNYIHCFDFSFNRYKESLKELVDEIATQLPCVIIINKINQVFMAAYAAKKIFGNTVKIISVIHSDFDKIYEQNAYVKNYVDSFMCVSNDVKNKFIEQYLVDREKVFFKDSPVYYDENYQKKYSPSNKPVVIGYGGRLEKAQKRADLLLPLIKKLEEYQVDYILNIAGEGSYYANIKEFITLYALEYKVNLLGMVEFVKMNEFWKQCDIFINLSEIEGIGLSMLEAMSVGAVPVVTDTAGAKSFIENGVNGYVNEIGDINSIADCIKKLCNDRESLITFGKHSRKIIKNRCNLEDYLDYINKIIES
jgi:glycosyltransferase involved in cell wall biosynthesis